MKFLDKLKNLINGKIQFSFLSNNSIVIVKNQNQDPIIYEKAKQKIFINISKLSVQERDELAIASREYVNEGNLLLETKSSDLLNELYLFKKTSNSTLEFFNGIISSTDFQALKASIFIRNKFEKGIPINDLKRDIIMRFGDRGRNISNLCSAGYFEEFLIPLYNSDKDNFSRIYEDLVANSMLAIFVNLGMNADDIPNELEKKILISKKYGFKFIHVHGIGKRNIKTIEEFINSKRKNLFNIEKIRYANPKEHILILELIFA